MEKLSRVVVLTGMFALLVLSLFIGAKTSAAESSSERMQGPQPQATPSPEARWIVAEGETASDWDIYITASDISGIVPDGGVIWAASSGGLLRWERGGGNLTQYLSSAVPFTSNNLDEILLHEGKLFISGYGGLTIFDRETSWVHYTPEDIGLETGYSTPIAMIDGVLWLAGEDGLAHLYPDGHWEVQRSGEQGLPSERIERIVAYEQGVYIVVASGPTVYDERWVMHLENENWERVEDLTPLYLETPDGALWKGAQDGLYRSLDRGGTWELVLQSGRWVRPHAFDAEGRVYAASDDAILVLDGEEVVEEYRFTAIGPELNFVNIIQWDNLGRMWIATDGRGMTMFDGEQWYNWQDGDAGLRDDCIRGLAIGDSSLYAGTHSSAGTGGVNVFNFEAEQWTNFWPGESELSGGGVDGIAVDDRGRVYFPTSEGVLDIFDGESWEHIPMPLPERAILSTSEGLFDENGNYWVGTEGLGLGLWRYDGEEWTVYDIPVHINALTFDQEERLWLATSDGLVVRDFDDTWWVYTADQLPLESGWIEDIAVDEEGRIWIIGYSCLVVFNGEEYRGLSPSVVGASGWGDVVTLDPLGNIWVEAGNGIAMFKGDPGIDGFAALVLPPAATIPEEEILLDADELESREMPTLPVAPSQFGNLVVLGMIWAMCGLCFIVLLIVIVILFFLVRGRKQK